MSYKGSIRSRSFDEIIDRCPHAGPGTYGCGVVANGSQYPRPFRLVATRRHPSMTRCGLCFRPCVLREYLGLVDHALDQLRFTAQRLLQQQPGRWRAVLDLGPDAGVVSRPVTAVSIGCMHSACAHAAANWPSVASSRATRGRFASVRRGLGSADPFGRPAPGRLPPLVLPEIVPR